MSFKQWIDFKQWSGDPPDEKFTIWNPRSWGTKKKNNYGGVLMIIWIFLGILDIWASGHWSNSTICAFSQGSVCILLLCGFLMLQIPLNQWVKYKQQLGLSRGWTTAHQSLGAVPAARWEWEGKIPNGRKNPWLLEEHQAGVRTEEPGGFSVPGVLGNSLSCLQGKGLPHIAVQRTAFAFCFLWVRGNCWAWEGWLQTLFLSHTQDNLQWLLFPCAFPVGMSRGRGRCRSK